MCSSLGGRRVHRADIFWTKFGLERKKFFFQQFSRLRTILRRRRKRLEKERIIDENIERNRFQNVKDRT